MSALEARRCDCGRARMGDRSSGRNEPSRAQQLASGCGLQHDTRLLPEPPPTAQTARTPAPGPRRSVRTALRSVPTWTTAYSNRTRPGAHSSPLSMDLRSLPMFVSEDVGSHDAHPAHEDRSTNTGPHERSCGHRGAHQGDPRPEAERGVPDSCRLERSSRVDGRGRETSLPSPGISPARRSIRSRDAIGSSSRPIDSAMLRGRRSDEEEDGSRIRWTRKLRSSARPDTRSRYEGAAGLRRITDQDGV